MGSSESTQKVEKAAEVEYSSGFHVVELHFPSTGPGILLLLLVIAGILCCACFCRRRCHIFQPSSSRQFQFPPYPFPMYQYPLPQYAPSPIPAPTPWTLHDTFQRPAFGPSAAQAISSSPQVTEVADDNNRQVAKDECKHSWKHGLTNSV